MPSPNSRLASHALLAIALLTVVLGLIGYSRANLADSRDGLNASGPIGHFFDLLYLSTQLLWMGGRDVRGEPLLMAVRWLGVLFSLGVIVRVIAPQIEERLVWLRIALLRGHTVVIGLGQKGRFLIAEGSARGRVVALDLASHDFATLKTADATEAEWRRARRRTFVLQGDGLRTKWLQRANVDHARRIYIVTDSDAVNVEVALRIRERAAADAGRATGIFPHVAEERLAADIPADPHRHSRMIVRPFSLPGMAARSLLARHPLPVAAREQGAAGMNLVFVGFDGYAQALLVHALRLGSLPGQHRPRITIFAADPPAIASRLARNYPALTDLVEHFNVRPQGADTNLSPDDLIDAEPVDPPRPVTAIFVVGTSDAEAAQLARRVRAVAASADRWRAPLFVRLERDIRQRHHGPLQAPSKVLAEHTEPFGDLRTLCRAVHEGDWQEQAAVALHASYQAAERSAAPAEQRSPAAREWSQLGEEFREANRRAVDHFIIKLAAAGRVVRGRTPILGAPLILDPGVLERLARLEHDSWSNEKQLAGWRYGPRRDDRTRHHDCLVPYDRLGAARRKDADQISRLGTLLAQPGAAAAAVARHGEQGEAGAAVPVNAGPATVFRERTIGLAGHNLITLEEARQVAAGVALVLGRMEPAKHLGAGGDEFWTIVTALAPGSDVVMTRALLECLERAVPGAPDAPSGSGARRYRLLVARGLGCREVVRLYMAGAGNACTPDGKRTLAQLSADTDARPLERLLDDYPSEEAACEAVIDLGPGGAGGEDDPAREQAGLAAAARYLVERCDELIVAIDPTRYGRTRPFDPVRWAADEGTLPENGTGALARDWLRRPCRNDVPGTLVTLAPKGLHVIEIGA